MNVNFYLQQWDLDLAIAAGKCVTKCKSEGDEYTALADGTKYGQNLYMTTDQSADTVQEYVVMVS